MLTMVTQLSIAYFLLWTCAYRGCKSETLQETILDNIDYFCPYGNVCADNDTAGDNTLGPYFQPCCTGCSCSEDCSYHGNCCFPDKNSVYSSIDEECLYPQTIPPPREDGYLYTSYYMVNTCPGTNITSDGDRSCSDTKVAPWGSLFPVYSITHGKHYKNHECAHCNDVDDGFSWSAFMTCETYNSVTGYDRSLPDHLNALSENRIPAHCEMKFLLPKLRASQTIANRICYEYNSINNCSRDEFDLPENSPMTRQQIIASCETAGFQSPYFAYDRYINIFCQMCNGRNVEPYTKCPKRVEDPRSTTIKSFCVLLNTDILQDFIQRPNNIERAAITTACKKEELADCKEVHCPTGQIYNKYGKCAYPTSNWLVRRYSVMLKLIPDLPLKQADILQIATLSKDDIRRSLKTALPTLWRLQHLYYQLNSDNVTADAAVNCFMAKFVLNIKVSQNAPLILKRLKTALKKVWSLRFSNATIRIRPEFLNYINIYYRGATILPGWYELWIRGQKSSESNPVPVLPAPNGTILNLVLTMDPFDSNTIPITTLYFCKQIELKPHEFQLDSFAMILHINTTGKFYFDGTFTLVETDQGVRLPRLCMDELGFAFAGSPNTSRLTALVLFLSIWTVLHCVTLNLSDE